MDPAPEQTEGGGYTGTALSTRAPHLNRMAVTNWRLHSSTSAMAAAPPVSVYSLLRAGVPASSRGGPSKGRWAGGMECNGEQGGACLSWLLSAVLRRCPRHRILQPPNYSPRPRTASHPVAYSYAPVVGPAVGAHHGRTCRTPGRAGIARRAVQRPAAAGGGSRRTVRIVRTSHVTV